MGSASIGRFATNYDVNLNDLQGQVVAIDGFIELNQYVHSITDDYGDYVRNDDGEPISHLIGLVSRLGPVLKAGINPVYVLDGGAPDLKDEELERRRSEDVSEEFFAAKEAGDEERAIQLSYKFRGLSSQMIQESKELIEAFGIPVVDAPGEAEPQCAQLVNEGMAHHVASQDWDTMLYEVDTMLRDFNASGATMVKLEDMLSEHDWTFDQLRWYAILRGTDYNRSARGVGAVYGRRIVNEAESFEDVLDAAEEYDDKLNRERWKRTLDLIENQEVEEDVVLNWEPFDIERVYDVACGTYGLADWQVKSRLKNV